MIPTSDIEGIVFDQIKALFRNPTMVLETWKAAKRQDKSITEQEVITGL